MDSPQNTSSENLSAQPFNPDDLIYRQATISEIIQLRHDVLIVGTNHTSPEFNSDFVETTHHFGAFLQNQVYCCLSMMRNDNGNQPAYQLRGMATHPDFQDKGVGKRLLHFAEQYIVEHTNVHNFHCNARVGYEEFYCKQGWSVISGPFLIEGVCMHVKMEKHIQDVNS